MIYRALLLCSILFLSGCSTMGLSPDAVAVVTEEYGQCLANTQEAPRFGKKKVTFRCEGDRVLLGSVYEKEGKSYIESGLLYEKGGKWRLKERQPAHFVRGMHSVCQLRPLQGTGDKEIKRYYFDIKLKKCRPFIWHGDSGFVPFENLDACEQYCNYQYQG